MTKQFLLDGQPVPFEDGQTILEASRAAGHYIPSLCWHKDFPPHGSCKLCVVKAAGRHVSACATPAKEG
ncbi:2Fe-2S iron-sulfur cluster-binding protein, partial [Zoogloea sp.]|uniref:2Fe-2S iron-sulfur cluster-binding protein n=1 Tax=Zoogloea sp. TaxID=49181 RepID=UPI002CCA9BCE